MITYQMKRHIIYNTIFIVFIITNFSFSQFSSDNEKYDGAFSELFFGRQPSARAESLGRSFVSISRDANSYYYNPAGLAFLEGLNVSGTYANPYYYAEEAKYIYLSASYKIKKYGVIGFSHDYFKLDDIVIVNELGEKIGEETLSLRNYRFSLSSEIIPDLFIGVNFNLFRGYELAVFL